MRLTIYWKYRDEEGAFHAKDQSEVIVGRPKLNQPMPDLNLKDPTVSRPHLHFKYDLNAWWVRDTNSSRGTRVNNEMVLNPLDWHELSIGDTLKIGDTLLSIDFDVDIANSIVKKPEMEAKKGAVEVVEDEETTPSIGPSQTNHRNPINPIEVLSKFHEVLAYAGGQNLLRAYLEIFKSYFLSSNHITIALVEGEDRQIIPREFYPHDAAYISLSLARLAIQKRTVVIWKRDDAEHLKATLDQNDMIYALYAPMYVGNDIVGVIHMDTSDPNHPYTASDADVIKGVANTIAMAIRVKENDSEMDFFPGVFISYKSENYEFVAKLEKQLRKRRLRPWFDDRLKVGEDSWQRELAQQIQKSDAFVVVLSELAVQSEWVLWEIDTAIHYKKPIFPIFIEKCDMPPVLIGKQAATMHLDKPETHEQNVQEIVTAIQNRVLSE